MHIRRWDAERREETGLVVRQEDEKKGRGGGERRCICCERNKKQRGRCVEGNASWKLKMKPTMNDHFHLNLLNRLII